MEFKELIKKDRKTALCLSEMAAIVADRVSLDSFEKCRVAVETFNRHYADALGSVVSADDVWAAMMELHLLPHFTISPKRMSPWRMDAVLVEMLLWGLLEGYIHWYDKKKRKTEVLVEKFTKAAKTFVMMDLDTMCSETQLYEIIADMVMLAKKQDRNGAIAEDWLFDLLCKYDLHSMGLLEDVCDTLFSTTIEVSASREMDRVLTGPNGDYFENYIHTSFVNSYHCGELRFGFAEGAVTIQKVLLADKKPLSLAERLCLQASRGEERLAYLAAMSLLIWSQLLDGPDPEPDYKPSEAFANMLSTLLLSPEKGYCIAASCAEDLILSGRLQASAISPEIAEAAVSALQDDGQRKWAEHILCLFEGKLVVEKVAKQKYALRFCREAVQLHMQSDAAITFGCCIAMQVWSPAEERSNLMELGRCYSRNIGCVDHYRLARLQRLLRRIFPDNRWFSFTDSADVINDLYSLSRKELLRWEEKLAQKDAKLHLTTKKDAVAFILFLSANYPYIITQPEPYRALVAGATLDLPEPGSFVVARWFEYLALLDLGAEAVTFYRKHKKLLDRPASFYPVNWHSNLEDALRFVHFFDHGSRFEDSLRKSLQLGKTGVLKAFLRCEYQPMIDSPLLWDRVLPWADASVLPELSHLLDGKYGLKEAAENRPAQEPQTKSGMDDCEPCYIDFYDDLSVILYAFKTKPAIRRHLKRWSRKVDPDLANEINKGERTMMKIYDPAKDQIVRNRIRCNQCNDIIESRHYHDFVQCSCGSCAVDGGLEYLRRLSRDRDGFEELAEFVPREDQI